MEEVTTEKPLVDKKRHFRKVIRKFNTETDFSFVLDKDEREDWIYAHATHTGDGYKVVCQLDTETNYPYGLDLKIDGIHHRLDLPSEPMSKEKLETLMKSEAFATRLGAIKLLKELSDRAHKEIENLKANFIYDVLTDSDKQDAYDTITSVARQLLRD